jgi:urea transport system permease protein
VAWAQTLFSERFPSEWTYAQGLLFIVVVGFFPAGFAGLGALRRWRRHKPAPLVPEPEPEPEAEKVSAS